MKFLIMIEDVIESVVICPVGFSVKRVRDLLSEGVGLVFDRADRRGISRDRVSIICELPSLLR